MIVSVAIRAILGYIIAASLTASVSFTITATAWASIWTYGWLILGYILASIAIWLVTILFGLSLMALALFLGKVVEIIMIGWAKLTGRGVYRRRRF